MAVHSQFEQKVNIFNLVQLCTIYGNTKINAIKRSLYVEQLKRVAVRKCAFVLKKNNGKANITTSIPDNLLKRQGCERDLYASNLSAGSSYSQFQCLSDSIK